MTHKGSYAHGTLPGMAQLFKSMTDKREIIVTGHIDKNAAPETLVDYAKNAAIQKEIKEALENATPGPWTWRKKKWEKGDGEWKDGEFNVGELRQKAEPGQSYNSILDVQKNKHGQPDMYAWVEEDAYLIANAPTWLLHQQQLIEQKERALLEQFEINTKLAIRIEHKDAEIDQLREASTV